MIVAAGDCRVTFWGAFAPCFVKTGYNEMPVRWSQRQTKVQPPARELRITELLASDLPEVVAIEQRSNLEPWTRESFLEELLKPHSFLQVARVREGGREMVAGFICFWLVADELQILNVAVHEAYRRQGIGMALMLDCLQFGFARTAGRAVLEVRAGNLAAQRLYRRLGFRVVGQRPDYYGGVREPALLMELDAVAASVEVGRTAHGDGGIEEGWFTCPGAKQYKH